MRQLLGKIWSSWKRFARALARVNTEIIIFLFYFLVFMPFGFVLKLFGHDPLKKRLKGRSTWQEVSLGRFDREKASHQS